MEDVMQGKGQGKLALCGCGKIHFSYGPVTLHFDREEFVLFAESVGWLGAMVKQAVHSSLFSSTTESQANMRH
ncbi:MAG TPA: hypothetical protein VIU63_07870 [Nitrospira sp.]